MSNTQSKQDFSIVAYESGLKKMGENIANRALDYVVESVKNSLIIQKSELE